MARSQLKFSQFNSITPNFHTSRVTCFLCRFAANVGRVLRLFVSRARCMLVFSEWSRPESVPSAALPCGSESVCVAAQLAQVGRSEDSALLLPGGRSRGRRNAVAFTVCYANLLLTLALETSVSTGGGDGITAAVVSTDLQNFSLIAKIPLR